MDTDQLIADRPRPVMQDGDDDTGRCRTLVDILRATALKHPAEVALDDGTETLTYSQLLDRAEYHAQVMHSAGVGRGDRVGIRCSSGRNRLYVSVVATLLTGAAYVPVDSSDPEDRVESVFDSAEVNAVFTDTSIIFERSGSQLQGPPNEDDDAWIIFTSGTTGTPKGVAVTHEAAAAFVKAEQDVFVQRSRIGPGDRVLASLSVAFDASCEEMWLAWANGATLVPVSRGIVAAGSDLSEFIREQRITVVSTVPTLASLWSANDLSGVRLLIFGGEPCPSALVERFATDDRELWNTYGPTEATVVSTAGRLLSTQTVHIGSPIPGWEIAIVDSAGQPVPAGEVGELVISGVGLGRYLDPELDKQKFAPLTALGWDRAYRSGDRARFSPTGIVFEGRADTQVKVGGRRIELGEIESALSQLDGVTQAAAKVHGSVIYGYVVGDHTFDCDRARSNLAKIIPNALMPRIVQLDAMPKMRSGKIDRNVLSPPDISLPSNADSTELWLTSISERILGAPLAPEDDFFHCGGSSVAAAQMVAAVRERYPTFSVSDVYGCRTISRMARRIKSMEVQSAPANATRNPATLRSGSLLGNFLVVAVTFGATSFRWISAIGIIVALSAPVAWTDVLTALALTTLAISPAGRAAISGIGARLLTNGLKREMQYERGRGAHLRVKAAENLANAMGMAQLVGTSWNLWYARLLGCKLGRDVELRTLPPVTGFLRMGDGATVEPEADIAGHWIDGNNFVVGWIELGDGARIGARSMLVPGVTIGAQADVSPGSTVLESIPDHQSWAGAPATRQHGVGESKIAPLRRSRKWKAGYQVVATLPSLLILLSIVPAIAAGYVLLGSEMSLLEFTLGTLGSLAFSWVTYAALVAAAIRIAGIGLREGIYPTDSMCGLRVWLITTLGSTARQSLFPLYAGSVSPIWLRFLGAQIGRNTEVSTIIAVPSLLSVGDGSFLADDVLVGAPEYRNGWMRIGPVRIGDRSFIGNSAIVPIGTEVPADSLVGVLSTAPSTGDAHSSWLGRPPQLIPRQRLFGPGSRTYAPTRRLRIARACVESARLLPVLLSLTVAESVSLALGAIIEEWGYLYAAALGWIILLAAGLTAGAFSVAAKWIIVGRLAKSQHPLWSSLVWRNELVENFTQMLAYPWLLANVGGSPLMNLWLRASGAQVGSNVWCETHWLPEPDLIQIGAGSAISRGGVIQTHLFHDRVLQIDKITLGTECSVGPHSTILPDVNIGERSTISGGSLVIRGERVPAGSRWVGNPIESWSAASSEAWVLGEETDSLRSSGATQGLGLAAGSRDSSR